MKISQRIKSDILLIFVAVIWGSAFVAQRVAAAHLGPFLFNGSRFLLGAFILIPIALKTGKIFDHTKLIWVLAGGFFLYVASALQQAGLKYTTAGNAGFITGLYVVFVPVFLYVGWKNRLSWTSGAAVLLAAVGLYYLSVQENFSLAAGDGLELAGAAIWALHVILVSRIVCKMNIIHFAIGQYLVCAFFNLVTGLIFERNTLPGFSFAYWTVLYTGILSVGLGYTLQAVGQRHSPPVDAAIILSMEAVFAALFGYIFLDEIFTGKQIMGSSMILSGIVIAQFKSKK